MSIFVLSMIAGLIGLTMMALPGVLRHGHAGTGTHGIGHGGHGVGHGHIAAHSAGHLATNSGAHGAAAAHGTGGHGAGAAGASRGLGGDLFHLIPSPRVIFSLLALFGAFGYGFVEVAHLTPLVAGIAAVVPALLVERFALTPLWNLMFRFEGTPCASLDELVLNEATAVTSFRNGRGMISVVRDGRVVQLRAEMVEPQKAIPVRVGDVLFVEEVDAANERVTVSQR